MERSRRIRIEARDAVAAPPAAVVTATGRNVVVTIGIDRYRHWEKLGNAVADAEGAAALFRRLGFVHAVAPLLDEQATGSSIEALATDELTALSENDSLIVFYAGHGGVRQQHVSGRPVRTGYLIPVDAGNDAGRVQSWIELEPWLHRISRLPPRHILVILDACFSGIALSPNVKWGRGSGSLAALPFAAAHAKPSRLIITSALDDERAMDSGPMPGHSLFTGCLIEALTGGLTPVGVHRGRKVTIGSELGHYLRTRVHTYPGRPGWQQTPDLGAFDFDERGEMLIPLLIEDDAPAASGSASLGATVVDAVAEDAVVADAVMADAVVADAVVADAVAAEKPRRRVVPWAIGIAIAIGVGLIAAIAARRVFEAGAEGPPGAPPSSAPASADPPPRSSQPVSPAPEAAPPALPAAPSVPEPVPSPPSAKLKAAVVPAAAPSAPAAQPRTCPAPVSSPRGAKVIWNGVVVTIPTTLDLPCGVAVPLMFRESGRADKTILWTATPDGKPIKIRMMKDQIAVRVDSTPKGASVHVGHRASVITPANIKLPANEPTIVTFTMDGYKPSEQKVTPTDDGMHVNVVLTPLAGPGSSAP